MEFECVNWFPILMLVFKERKRISDIKKSDFSFTTTQLDEVSKKYNTCMSFFKQAPKDETIYSEDEI